MLCLLSLAVIALFAWLISHQPAVLFSQTKSATSNQPAVLFSQNKPAPAISHQPTEQAACKQMQAEHSCDRDGAMRAVRQADTSRAGRHTRCGAGRWPHAQPQASHRRPPRAWPQGGVPHAPTAPPRFAASVRTRPQCRAPVAPHAATAVPHIYARELQAQDLQLPTARPRCASSSHGRPTLDLQFPPSLPTIEDDKSVYLALLELPLRRLERWGGWREERGGAGESVTLRENLK
jgi:hypothetical protein